MQLFEALTGEGPGASCTRYGYASVNSSVRLKHGLKHRLKHGQITPGHTASDAEP